MVKQSLRLADRSAPLDSYEIEEAFGTGRFLRRAPGRQVVRLHGPWQLCAPALGFDPSAPEHSSRIVDEGRAIAAADAVTSPSQHALDSVRRYYDLPLREAAVIPNAVALAPASARWSLERATPFSVLFVGRFDRLKGADTVLEAFGRLHAKIPEATLTFVGPDRGMPDGAGGTIHFEDFAARVLEPAARARVTYLGPRTRSEIADLRTRAAITVVASRFETFGMTVVEAMAAASPVIAARAGALPEVLRWADADALFEAGSAPALADALHRWLTDRERLASHADRGRAACAADYSPRTVAQRTLELHRRVTGRRAT
jgi:glycosyltransferase involved in cell wall biosynthesis